MSRFARITEDPDYDNYHDDTTDWEQTLDPEDPNQLQENNNKDFFANSLENYSV